MNSKKGVGFILLLLLGMQAVAQRPVRFEVKVPSMNCEQCEQIIQDKLWKRVDGIVEIDAKWKAKKVVIKFIPDRVDSANIKLMIADLGFDASDELADEDAMKRLPECCRRVVKPKAVEAPKPPTAPQPTATATPTKPTPTTPAKRVVSANTKQGSTPAKATPTVPVKPAVPTKATSAQKGKKN